MGETSIETVDTSTPMPTAADYMRGGIQSLIKESVEFKRLMDTAKTQTKKNFYHKKLAKHNDLIMKSLMVLDRHEKMHGDTSN